MFPIAINLPAEIFKLPEGIVFDPRLLFVVTLLAMSLTDLLKEFRLMRFIERLVLHPPKVINYAVSILVCLLAKGLTPDKLRIFGSPVLDGIVAGLAVANLAAGTHNVGKLVRRGEKGEGASGDKAQSGSSSNGGGLPGGAAGGAGGAGGGR